MIYESEKWLRQPQKKKQAAAEEISVDAAVAPVLLLKEEQKTAPEAFLGWQRRFTSLLTNQSSVQSG